MLTPKQEVFCREIASGKTAKNAYVTAYNTKASDQVLYNESIKLMLRDDIQARIKEIRKPLEQAVNTQILSEREKKRAWLWNMIENATNDSDRIRAMDILNKMDSEYINIQRIEQENTPIQELDTNKLIEITKLA